MKTRITRSVGRNGINNKDDVTFIQSALNTYAKKHASNSFPLKVDGACGAKTTQAIYNFQRNHVGIIIPDARIDPNGKTFRHLTLNTTHTAAERRQAPNIALVNF